MASVSRSMLHLERHHSRHVALPHTDASPESTGDAFWSFSVLTPLSLIERPLICAFLVVEQGAWTRTLDWGLAAVTTEESKPWYSLCLESGQRCSLHT